jgi:hypothetical protein
MSQYEKYNKPWRSKNPDKRNEQKKRNYARGRFGLPHQWNWTLEEDELVLRAEISDRELASQINRSVQAIQVRRCNLLARQRDRLGANAPLVHSPRRPVPA